MWAQGDSLPSPLLLYAACMLSCKAVTTNGESLFLLPWAAVSAHVETVILPHSDWSPSGLFTFVQAWILPLLFYLLF